MRRIGPLFLLLLLSGTATAAPRPEGTDPDPMSVMAAADALDDATRWVAQLPEVGARSSQTRWTDRQAEQKKLRQANPSQPSRAQPNQRHRRSDAQRKHPAQSGVSRQP